MAAEEIVDGLKAIGWFEGRSPGAAAELLEHLEQVEADGYPGDFLYREIADVTYLTDGAEDEDSYEQLVQEFATASRGLFAPANIASEEDEDGEGLQRLTFTLAGREYSIPYDPESKYIEADIAQVINGALATAGVKERFCYLPTVDEEIALVFVRPEVHTEAVTRGLIPSSK